jgi:Carboxypeptidase regulatory-like domain
MIFQIMKIFTKLVLLLLITIASLSGQDTKQPKGTITGTAVDAVTREPLFGVNITLIGTSFGAVTNADGRFTIKDVAPGTYSVRASVLGFSPVVKSDIVVNPIRPVSKITRCTS